MIKYNLDKSESRRQLYQEFIDAWGKDAQILMAVEEMSELTKELCKYYRFKNNPEKLAKIKQNIIEETADVANMIEQLEFMFGEAEVKQVRQAKLLRCKSRLEQLKQK